MSSKQESVLVMGASPNPSRYSYMATNKLSAFGHTPVPFGARKGEIGDHQIVKDLPQDGIDTVTMYLGAPRQKEYYDYFIKLKPTRIIFNPGAENPELEKLANEAGIETENACTLVMLQVGTF